MKKAKLIRNVLAVLAVLATVVCVSCDALLENGRRGNITINLPPISSSARAISADKINDLKGDIASYRVIVKVNGQRREKRGGGGNYSFEMPVGVKIEITVECLNASGNVIVRAKKTHTVKSGTNNVDINLSRDGDVVGTGGSNPPSGGNTPPAPPAPVQGQVTYNGNGADSGTLSDTQNYDTGSEVTLQTGEPTRAGYEFAGWTADKELKYDDAGQEQTIPQGVEFASSGSNVATNIKITSFKMPSGGVVLTAKWTPITYTIKFNNGGGSGSQADLQFTVEDTNKALPTANEVTFSPPQGKAFDCWATSNNGLTTNLEFIISLLKTGATGNLEMSGNDITIYAIWEDRPDLTSTPVAGDIIMKDGTLKKASDTDINADDTIAIVYKVDSSARKVWAVGKVVSSPLSWCYGNCKGYDNEITTLLCEPDSGSSRYNNTWTEGQNTDGSDNWQKLKDYFKTSNLTDDTGTPGNYPAWEYCNNYGTTNCANTNFETGWYLPTNAELWDVSKEITSIENVLKSINSNLGITDSFWSSTQQPSDDTANKVKYLAYTLILSGTNLGFGKLDKHTPRYVCAVRQFSY